MPLRVAVIGAGIVGVSTALELVSDGFQVALGEPGGSQATGDGNGAWLSPASLVPMSVPGLWRKVPGYLLDQTGPLTVRWSQLPRLARWLPRFVPAGGTVQKAERTARAAEIGRPDRIRRRGLLSVSPDRAAFESEALSWRLRRDNGVGWIELGPEELFQREPSLSRRYAFGVLVEQGAHCIDPGGYVAALAAHACSLTRGERLPLGAIVREAIASRPYHPEGHDRYGSLPHPGGNEDVDPGPGDTRGPLQAARLTQCCEPADLEPGSATVGGRPWRPANAGTTTPPERSALPRRSNH